VCLSNKRTQFQTKGGISDEVLRVTYYDSWGFVSCNLIFHVVDPILELWFKVDNMCLFEIRVEQVWKDIVKAFIPKGCMGIKKAEKQCSWPPRLQGRMNSFEWKGACPVHMRTKIKTSFDLCLKYLHKKML